MIAFAIALYLWLGTVTDLPLLTPRPVDDREIRNDVPDDDIYYRSETVGTDIEGA